MKVQATLHNYRRSPKKVVQTAKLLRGLMCADAIAQLDQLDKKDSDVLKKLIMSAMANAQNNFRLEKSRLFVETISIGAGQTMKRWRARAHGRAASILKRTCQITVILDEKKMIDQGKKAKVTKTEEKSKSEKAVADDQKKSAPKKESEEKKAEKK